MFLKAFERGGAVSFFDETRIARHLIDSSEKFNLTLECLGYAREVERSDRHLKDSSEKFNLTLECLGEGVRNFV